MSFYFVPYSQTQLDLDSQFVKSLNTGDLSAPTGILECTAAAQQLLRCMNADIHPGTSDIKTVLFYKHNRMILPEKLTLNGGCF